MTDKKIDSEWTRCEKIDWEAIPDNVVIVLEAMKNRWCSYVTRMTRWDEEEFRQKAAKISTELSVANIEAAFDWVANHSNHGFTHFVRNGKRLWRVSMLPKVMYRNRWNGRGLGSTYRHNYFTISNIGRVGQWNRFEGLCINRWEEFNEDAIKKQHETTVAIFERRVLKAEQASAAYHLSYDEIKDKIFTTLNNFRCGRSGSSHGNFSFALDYCTNYIDKDSGNLIAIDKTDINWYLPDPQDIPEKYLDLRYNLSQLIGRFWTAHEIQHQRSVIWKSAWDEITKVMSEHSQQGVVQ